MLCRQPKLDSKEDKSIQMALEPARKNDACVICDVRTESDYLTRSRGTDPQPIFVRGATLTAVDRKGVRYGYSGDPNQFIFVGAGSDLITVGTPKGEVYTRLPQQLGQGSDCDSVLRSLSTSVGDN